MDAAEILNPENRYRNYELAAEAMASGRAAKILGTSGRPTGDIAFDTVVAILRLVFIQAAKATSTYDWAERILRSRYPVAWGRPRRNALAALKQASAEKVPIGWNAAMAIILSIEGSISTSQGLILQSAADDLYLKILGVE